MQPSPDMRNVRSRSPGFHGMERSLDLLQNFEGVIATRRPCLIRRRSRKHRLQRPERPVAAWGSTGMTNPYEKQARLVMILRDTPVRKAHDEAKQDAQLKRIKRRKKATEKCAFVGMKRPGLSE